MKIRIQGSGKATTRARAQRYVKSGQAVWCNDGSAIKFHAEHREANERRETATALQAWLGLGNPRVSYLCNGGSSQSFEQHLPQGSICWALKGVTGS